MEVLWGFVSRITVSKVVDIIDRNLSTVHDKPNPSPVSEFFLHISQ